MYRKFLNCILTGALFVGLLGVAVSCQDYDSDIKDLREQISQTSTDLTSLINEKINTVESEISSLTSQLSALDAAYQAADTQLKADLQAAIDGALEEAEAYAKIQADQAEEAAIAAAEALIEEAVATLQAQLDKVNETLNAQAASIAELVEADAALQEGIDAAAAAAAKAQETAETALALAEQNETAITELTSVVNNLSATVDNLKDQVSILNEEVEELYKTTAENAAAITALKAELTSLEESNEAAHEALQGQIDDLAELVAENQEAVEQALADLEESLEEEIVAALNEAKAYVDETVDALIEELYGNGDDVDGDINVLYTLAQNLETDLGDLATTVEGLTASVETLETALADLNQFFVLGDRLTSLVFAPTTYVDGIEAICFNDVVLSYTAWTVAEGEAPVQDGDTYELPIPDQIHVEEYLYSPSSVNPLSIEELAYVSNTATEISTKAVSETAPIEVKDYEFITNENGVKVLAVTVELVDELPTAENTFTTVALKATIADDYKLDSEANTEVAVFSDWARVYNVAGEATPYIHNAAYEAEVEDEEGDEHWYDYATIYALGGTTDDPATYPDEATAVEATIDSYVAADVAYTKTFDLNSLVTVCDKEGNFYDLETYGFAFEFALVDFYCVNDPDDTEEVPVNQADYASIDEYGVISSVGYRDAIGKYPVVQITLIDTTNEAIVDVKYVAIHWTDEAASYELGEFTLDGSYYDTCGAEYELIISGVDLQRKLASISEISLEELATTYELVGLFAEPYDGTNEVDETLGTIAYTTNGSNTMADLDTDDETTYTYADYCLIWTLKPTIDQDIYDAGEMAFTAYGAFVNEAGDNYVTFELYTDFSIAQMELLFVHNQPYWSSSVNEYGYLARVTNPTTEDDAIFGMNTSAEFATTQLVCNLYIGYIKDGVTPSGALSIIEEYMINFGEQLYLRLDETRVQELADETGTEVEDWTFNATDMNLFYKGVQAAHIQYDNDLKAMVCYLYDGAISTFNPRPEGSAGTATATPSEGAKLLVGKFVPMVMYSTWCGCTEILDQFDVAFMIPLALESSETVEVTLKDIYAGGSSSEASLDNTIKLVEYAIQNHRTVWSNYEEDPSDETLVGWYGVEAPVFDLENATTNLTLDGDVSDEEDFENWTIKLSDIQTMDGDPVYTIEYDEETNELIYYNHSGTAITKAFKICIPVTIATKWQDVIALNVIVNVEPSLN